MNESDKKGGTFVAIAIIVLGLAALALVFNFVGGCTKALIGDVRDGSPIIYWLLLVALPILLIILGFAFGDRNKNN